MLVWNVTNMQPVLVVHVSTTHLCSANMALSLKLFTTAVKALNGGGLETGGDGGVLLVANAINGAYAMRKIDTQNILNMLKLDTS